MFSVRAEEDSLLWDFMLESYSPFESAGGGDERFCLTLVDSLAHMDGELVYSDEGNADEGFPSFSIFEGPEGRLYEITQPGSDKLNARLLVIRPSLQGSVDADNLPSLQGRAGRGDGMRAFLMLDGSDSQRWFSFTSAMNICYILATSAYSTVLTHSSSVIYKGWAYIFLGKSGTGKSTHSRMWGKALDGVVLMNDDHPVLRVEDDGTVMAYGSPWSGKTHCYKKLSAPLGGIIRISRAPYNKATRQAGVQAYASLMASCSSIVWDADLADGRHGCLEAIIAKVPSYVMECLPDEDAARVCCAAVRRDGPLEGANKDPREGAL